MNKSVNIAAMAASYERTSVPGIYRRGGRYSVTFTDPTGRRRKKSAGDR